MFTVKILRIHSNAFFMIYNCIYGPLSGQFEANMPLSFEQVETALETEEIIFFRPEGDKGVFLNNLSEVEESQSLIAYIKTEMGYLEVPIVYNPANKTISPAEDNVIGRGANGAVAKANLLKPDGTSEEVLFKWARIQEDERSIAEVQREADINHDLGMGRSKGIMLSDVTEYFKYAVQIIENRGESLTKELLNSLTHIQRVDLAISFLSEVQRLHSGYSSKSRTKYAHRDIGPNNFLVTVEGGKAVARLIDFGGASPLAENPRVERQGTLELLPVPGDRIIQYYDEEQSRILKNKIVSASLNVPARIADKIAALRTLSHPLHHASKHDTPFPSILSNQDLSILPDSIQKLIKDTEMGAMQDPLNSLRYVYSSLISYRLYPEVPNEFILELKSNPRLQSQLFTLYDMSLRIQSPERILEICEKVIDMVKSVHPAKGIYERLVKDQQVASLSRQLKENPRLSYRHKAAYLIIKECFPNCPDEALSWLEVTSEEQQAIIDLFQGTDDKSSDEYQQKLSELVNLAKSKYRIHQLLSLVQEIPSSEGETNTRLQMAVSSLKKTFERKSLTAEDLRAHIESIITRLEECPDDLKDVRTKLAELKQQNREEHLVTEHTNSFKR